MFLATFDFFDIWMAWAAVMVLAIIVKLCSREYISAAVAVGAFCAAVTAFIMGGPKTLTIQVIVFVAATLLFAGLIQPYAMRKTLERQHQEGMEKGTRMRGKKALVVQTIDNMAGQGAITVEGQRFKARSSNGTVFQEGQTVTIVDQDSSIMIVM